MHINYSKHEAEIDDRVDHNEIETSQKPAKKVCVDLLVEDEEESVPVDWNIQDLT